jgi:tetratricopeptide (TPR) repeat protein
MPFSAHSTFSRALRRVALTAGSMACLAPAACGPSDPLEAIRQQQAAGDMEASIEALRELLAEQPDHAEANYLYGRTLVLTQRPNLATWSLSKAMEDPEWLIPAGLMLAELSLGNRDIDEVDALTGRILERDPENIPALLLRANAHAQSNQDPERALADAERVLELDPEVLVAFEPRIMALIALGRKEEAGEALAEAGRRLTALGAGKAVLAWHCSATSHLQQDLGDIEGARDTLNECLEAHPADLRLLSRAMSFHDSLGEQDRSLEIARAALEHAPASRAVRFALVERLVLAGRPAEAEAVLREATRSPHPQLAAAAWLDLGRLRNRLGEYDAAVEAIGRAVELESERGTAAPQLVFDYADTLVVAGRLERALEVAEGLSVPAHRHLIRARVAQERRQPALALEEFAAGLRLWPDNPYGRYYAALAAEELGDFDRALEELRYSVRNSPGATESRIRGARLLLAEGRPRGALEMLLTGTGRGHPMLEVEGHLLAMRLYGSLGNLAPASALLEQLETSVPAWVGVALAETAEGAALRAGPAAAKYEQPRFAAALRALVRFAHEAGETAAAQAALRAALAAHPDSGAFQEIRGLDLELSGAPSDAVGAAYTRALELEPGNARALEGLGRLALDDDPAAAFGFFDRAAAADPSDPGLQLQAARALAASGRAGEAAERLDALLLLHPYHAEAAAARAGLDLERGMATPQTLERARRAVRFGGGADALELLSRVHEQRGEPQAAAQAAERARGLREAQAEG